MGKRPNLHFFLSTWVYELLLNPSVTSVTGVRIREESGIEKILTCKHEVILAAGSIDTPRLLLLSGIGPKKDLESVGITCKYDVKGVGENLVDHAVSSPPECRSFDKIEVLSKLTRRLILDRNRLLCVS